MGSTWWGAAGGRCPSQGGKVLSPREEAPPSAEPSLSPADSTWGCSWEHSCVSSSEVL